MTVRMQYGQHYICEERCHRMKRRVAVVLGVIIWSSQLQHPLAYVPLVGPRRSTYSTRLVSSRLEAVQKGSEFDKTTSSRQTNSANRSGTSSNSKQSIRLTREEELELLRQAAEMRRLKALEMEMALQPPTSNNALLVRARKTKAAGYGDDWQAYQDAIDQGHIAREKLVTRNMGLVHFCVNDIMGKGGRRLNSLSREDLIQEGAIGLARAVDKWNLAIGGKFSTYAVYWIRAAVLRCIAERDDLLRVPEHVTVAVRKMTAAARRLGMDIDGDNLLSSVYALSSSTTSLDASWKEAQAAKELAEEAGLTNGQLVQAMKARDRRNNGGYIAFEDWMQKGQDGDANVKMSLVVTDGSMEQLTMTHSLDLDHLVNTLSKFLRPKEMEALCWRYGLFTQEQQHHHQQHSKPSQKRNYMAEAEQELFGDVASSQPQPKHEPLLSGGGRWGEAMSFHEVGKQMKVSAEYGRRLCHAALEKLRRAAEEGRLEPALLLS